MTTSGNLPNPRRLGAVASTAALFLLAGLLAAGCGSAASTPTPTLAPRAPRAPRDAYADTDTQTNTCAD